MELDSSGSNEITIDADKDGRVMKSGKSEVRTEDADSEIEVPSFEVSVVGRTSDVESSLGAEVGTDDGLTSDDESSSEAEAEVDTGGGCTSDDESSVEVEAEVGADDGLSSDVESSPEAEVETDDDDLTSEGVLEGRGAPS